LPQRRRGLLRRLAALAGALALVAGAVQFGATSAAFSDSEYATGTVKAGWPPLTPVQTTLARTAMALDEKGGLYIWGYRGDGLSATGADVAGNAPATYISSMPTGSKVDQVTGFTTGIASSYYAYDTGIAALDTDGRVWIWGINSNRLAGITTDWGESFDRPWRLCFNGQRLYMTSPGPTKWADVNKQDWKCRDHATGTINDTAQPKIVDLKSTANTLLALDSAGNLYAWGGLVDSHAGQSSSDDKRYSYWPRKILTGVHSFGTSLKGVWAVVTDGWTRLDYADNGTAIATYATEGPGNGVTVESYTGDGQRYTGCTAAAGKNCAGLLYWGVQSAATGNPRGDGTSGYVNAPVQVAATSNLMKYFLANRADPNDATKACTDTAKADHCPGVRQGSEADLGVFPQMSGTKYGSQFRLPDGSLFLWGNSGEQGSGLSGTTTALDTETPTRVVLSTPAGGNPGTVEVDTLTGLDKTTRQPVASKVAATKVSVTYWRVLVLDATGTVWTYGDYLYHDSFPGNNASCSNNQWYNGTFYGDIDVLCRLDGSYTSTVDNEGWKAGTIMDIGTSGAGATLVHKATDATRSTAPLSVWIVGYNVVAGAMVRSELLTTQTSPASSYQKLLQIKDAADT
jgi:alpha-tubulin suppressor-like RCC1 family protein